MIMITPSGLGSVNHWPAGDYHKVGGTCIMTSQGLGTRNERHVETLSLHGRPIGSQSMAACMK